LTSYRIAYIEKQIEALRDNPKIIALMESVMPPIAHRYIEPAGLHSDLTHRIYFHDDAPAHFFADVGVLPEDARASLSEHMTIERHGTPVVYFDDQSLIKPQPIDKAKWRARLQTRVQELEASLPIYIVQVLKPLDRHQYTEAFAFYYHGLLRRLVELMGIRFRPYRYDFELRYLERDFPAKEQAAIHAYMKYIDPDDLRKKVAQIEGDFKENLAIIEKQGIQLL